MLVINYSISYKALDQFVEHHNDSHEALSDKIKASVLLTAKEIIRIYGVFLLKANGLMELTAENLPALKTNNSQLANLVKVSPRTIQRHIIKLQEAGIITGKEFCGSNSGYELLINPKILLARCRKDLLEAEKELQEAKQKNTEYQQVENKGTTNCPHTYTSNNSYNKNNLLIDVDNSNGSSPDQRRTGNQRNGSSLSLTEILSKAGYPTGNTLTGNTREKVAKKFEDAREKVRKRANNEQNWKQQDGSARSTSLNFYAESLWKLAKNLLYRDVFLTEFQENQAKQMLVKWYEPVSDKYLSAVHEHYSERVCLVRDYIAKDPEKRFVQLPYRYFDTNNPSGFTGTKKWLQKHLERKEEVRKKLILHAQIKKYLNNEKKTDSNRKSSLQVYRECETRIGKLQDQSLLHLFHAAVLKPEVIHQIR